MILEKICINLRKAIIFSEPTSRYYCFKRKEERDIKFIGKLNNNYIVLKMLYIKLKRVEDLNTKNN